MGLLLRHLLLVLLVFCFQSVFGSLVDGVPHITDDSGDLCDFSGRVFGLDSVIDFSSVEEKGREGPLGGGWLCKILITLSEFSFLPIIYNLYIGSPLYDYKSCIMLILI